MRGRVRGRVGVRGRVSEGEREGEREGGGEREGSRKSWDEGAICHMPLTQPTCNATLAFSMSSATLSSSFSRSESVVLASTYWLFHFYRNSHMR